MAAMLSLTACGGGGGGSSGDGNTGSAFGSVQLLSHSPVDGAVQVAVDTVFQFEFDAPMAVETFGDQDTWLRKDGSSTNVPGQWSRGSQGRVAFAPSGALDLESDYTFHLSGLTGDLSGRILDTEQSFAFRTYDATPPQFVSIDVVDNSTNQSRTRTYTLTFSEPLGAASVNENSLYLRDSFGFRYAAARTLSGSTVTLDPWSDLPGDRQFFVVATDQIADRAGNRLATGTNTRFRTATDSVSPRVLSTWPTTGTTGVSPRVQPTFAFDESMDPGTVEPASLLFQDEFGSVVPFAIETPLDQRSLRVRPLVTLQQGRTYTLAFLLGGAAATDVSGNVLQATQALSFRTGTDGTAPQIVSSSPADAETRVPATAIATIVFDEAMDAAWVGTSTVTMTVGGAPWTAVVELPSPATIRVTPVLNLPTNTTCSITVRGGHEGVRDVAGNVRSSDTTVSFTTSTDAGSPGVVMLPPEGAVGVAPNSRVSFLFDAAMDRATLSSATVQVLTDAGQAVPGQTTVDEGDRTVHFTPSVPFSAFTYYRLRVLGGASGPRRTTGNWFATDQTARFRTGATTDATAPVVTLSVNGIEASRSAGLVLPPSGFTVEVNATDTGSQWPDMGSVEIVCTGPGSAPGASTLLAKATFGYGTWSVTMPETTPLADGGWVLSARVSDLAGNVGTSASLGVTVATPDGKMLPFERTQVVWVRTDLDRNGNGVADFDDDMLRLGLGTVGDPIGSNARVRGIVLAGILAKSNQLFGRGDRGQPIDGGSVALRFSERQPIGIAHMQMALGGFDPEGSSQRTYGMESTGVLGRAYYDYRNGNPSERNIATSPGLGVFPGEMWLYQTRIHAQVWPSFQTLFAQKFRPLCPDMGGIAAGAHALDSVVLSPSFDYATGSGPERARWQTIMDAADDWATVIGIILAHEVGHSVGLVAPGASPTGLFGDSSLHDSYANAAEVMAASVGYEAMTTLDYHFRDIDLAYLRQRVLLR